MLGELFNTQLLLTVLQTSFLTHDKPYKGISYLCRDREMVTLNNETIQKVGKLHSKVGDTKITCEKNTLELSCGPGKVLNILEADYGYEQMSSCFKSNSRINTYFKKCSSTEETYKKVKERCNSKRSCQMMFSKEEFSDPCPNIPKHLMVRYDCVAPEFKTESLTVCLGYTRSIACPEGKTITVLDAMYGRDGFTCRISENVDYDSDKNCRSPDSLNTLSRRCDDKAFCELASGKGWFDGSCYFSPNYLKVDYLCRPVNDTQLTTQVNETQLTPPVAENKTIEISPGAPIIVGTTADSVTFYIDRLTPDLFKYYKVQMKEATEGDWFDVIDGNGFDFSKDQTIKGFGYRRLYDIRIVVKDVDFKANCIPFTRFMTTKRVIFN